MTQVDKDSSEAMAKIKVDWKLAQKRPDKEWEQVDNSTGGTAHLSKL